MPSQTEPERRDKTQTHRGKRGHAAFTNKSAPHKSEGKQTEEKSPAPLPFITAARVSPFRCVFQCSSVCETSLIYLIINAFPVESYVNSESGRIMMRGEQGLLVRLIPHYKVQVGGTLMRKETRVRQNLFLQTMSGPH